MVVPNRLWQLLALLGLAVACKKDEVVPLPTPFAFTIFYQQAGVPVDSAVVEITGNKGSIYDPPVISRPLFKGYTDAFGRIQGTINVPSDMVAVFNCYKFVMSNNRLVGYSMARTYPYTQSLKRGENNVIEVELDTLR